MRGVHRPFLMDVQRAVEQRRKKLLAYMRKTLLHEDLCVQTLFEAAGQFFIQTLQQAAFFLQGRLGRRHP